MVSRSLPRRTLRPGLTASCPPFDTVRFGPGSAVASIHPSMLAVSMLAPQAPPRLARLRPVQFRRPLTHATSETRPGSRRRGLGLAVPRDCTSHKSRAFWPDCAASSRVGKQTNGQAHTSRTVRRDRTVDFSMAKRYPPSAPSWVALSLSVSVPSRPSPTQTRPSCPLHGRAAEAVDLVAPSASDAVAVAAVLLVRQWTIQSAPPSRLVSSAAAPLLL